MIKKIPQILGVFLVLVISLGAILALFHNGFFAIHDNTQVQRVYEMFLSLKDGLFPVRWVPDLGYGYGYPIFTFYAPLAYYIGGFLAFIGFNALVATKIMIGVGMLVSGVGMYLLAREFWGETGGIVSAALYVYAPYHALDIYVRGDIAESWAYAFIPLAFWGFYKIFTYHSLHDEKRVVQLSITQWRWGIVAAVGFAGIIISHNLTAFMVTPFLALFVGILSLRSDRNKQIVTTRLLLISFILGILLATFYWLPTIMEMKYTNVISQIGGGSNFHDHFVCLRQLWDSPWGYGGSIPGCTDGLSFRIGKLHILLSLLSLLVFALYMRKKSRPSLFVGLFSGFALLFCLFLTLEISRPLWELLSPMAFFQFPWRFLLLISFFSSLIGGAAFWPLRDTNLWIKIGSGVLVSILIGAFYTKLFAPQQYLSLTAQDFTSKKTLRITTSAISDEYMPPGFIKPKRVDQISNDKVVLVSGKATIKIQQDKTQIVTADIAAQTTTLIRMNIAYFPAWQFSLDGIRISPKVVHNLYMFSIPKGNHQLTCSYQSTPIERIANGISVTSIAVLATGILYVRKRRYGSPDKKENR